MFHVESADTHFIYDSVSLIVLLQINPSVSLLMSYKQWLRVKIIAVMEFPHISEIWGTIHRKTAFVFKNQI